MKSPDINVGTLIHFIAGTAELLTAISFGVALYLVYQEYAQYAPTTEQALRLAFSDTTRIMAIPLIASLVGGPVIHIAAINSES